LPTGSYRTTKCYFEFLTGYMALDTKVKREKWLKAEDWNRKLKEVLLK
jgi:hypothetical protein